MTLRALVTGAGGFLGGAIAGRLVAEGHQVISLQRGDYPALQAIGVTAVRGDLNDIPALRQATQSVDVVFHVAALAGYWGDKAAYQRTNVDGTSALIEAAKTAGVERFVYTSTPSVVHAGGSIAGADESLPYPDHFAAAYPETKAAAERLVLATDEARFRTVALRPHLIWGPGDRHLLPRMVARAKTGKLKMIDGGHNTIDATYIDNAVDAHLLAEQALRNDDSRAAGKAYFIANDEPIEMVELVRKLLATQGIDYQPTSISSRVAKPIASAMAAAWRLLPLPGEPPLTPFLVEQFTTDHWYDLSAAGRDLGYDPKTSTAEGLTKLGAEHSTPKS